MSNKHRPQGAANGTKPLIVTEPERPVAPQHKQCPWCYGGRGGVGIERWHTRINGTLMRYCYDCDTCGRDWTVNVREVKTVLNIEHRVVDLEGR